MALSPETQHNQQEWATQAGPVISSFYGPGSWAAWVIVMVTSWIPLLQDDHSHNMHFISYALYTNWAAIDALRQQRLRWQMPPFRWPTHPANVDAEFEEAFWDVYSVSQAVVIVGTAQACAQLFHFMTEEMHFRTMRTETLDRQRLV